MNNTFHDMDFAVQVASAKPGKWVVMLFPPTKNDTSGKKRQVFLRCMFACTCPVDAELSGRTALLPNGSRISFACANQDVFVPTETPFKIYLVGWEGSDNRQGLKKWSKRASFLLPKN